MQTIYGVTSGENIVQAFTEDNTTEANFHQSINNAAVLTFTTTEPLKDGVRFFLTKDPINDYKHEEFMYFEITDQDFDGYEYAYRAEEYAYHDLDTMGYVKRIYHQGTWTTKSLLESITYNDVEPKGIARTKWEIIDNDLTLPTTWAGEENGFTLWYNTPLRGIEKFIEYFGGEIRFYVTILDNKISRHYLEIYEKRGRETGKRYESNSNLISLTNKAEYGDRYEYIIPLAEGGGANGDEETNNTPNGFNNYITLGGLEVGTPTDNWYKPKSQLYVSLANDKNAYPLKSQPKGLQNNPRIKPVTFEEVKSKEALFDKAIEWLENNQGVAWSYSASVLDIGESQVGDTIAIIDERSGISSYVRVHDIDYDMIDPENTGVHFGSNWGYENDEAITDMLNTATSAQRDTLGLIDTAIRQSNGKNTNYYGENEPANPIEGDLWYWQSGDESGIKIYHDDKWVDLVDSNTVQHINEQVDNALSDAKTYSDELSEKNKKYSDDADKTLLENLNIKIKSKTDEATVLQLFQDNFALGIKNNTGKIISGINGDSSGLVISGKRIVVDGDTTFTGNNFMNAAIIKDGTIGTAKIGDLAVTSAKISDLNVDKLTGNVSSFIKSKWDSAYSNVTIDSTGLEINTHNQYAKLTQGSLVLKSYNDSSRVKENIGWVTHTKAGGSDWVDYLAIVLDGYSDNSGGGKNAVHGADGFSININEGQGNSSSRSLLEWASVQAGRVTNKDSGWHVQDRIYFEKGLHAHSAPEYWRVSWTAWSDWGNYRNVSLTNPNGSAGIAVNRDNLILFGTNKRTDGTKGWNV